VDRRADIWAFGVVLTEMLTGRALYTGETVSEILAAVILKEPAIPEGLPAFVRQLLRRCLDRDAAQRLQAIGEARIALTNPVVGEPAAAGGKSSRVPWVVAAAAALAALAFAGLWLRRPAEEPGNVRFQIAPPEKTIFASINLALSPDGRRILFAADQDGSRKLWVRDLDAAEARPVAGTEGLFVGSNSFWSPDGRYIGFFQGGKLKKVDIAGGNPVTLCDTGEARGGSWSARDTIVFASSSYSGLSRVAATGGTAGTLTELEAGKELSHRWPVFLPDGRHFLFYVRGVSPDQDAVWMGDLDSKQRRRVVAANGNASYDPRGLLLFVRQGTLVAQPWDAARNVLTGDVFPVAEQVSYTPNNSLANFSISQTGVLAWYSGAATGNMRLNWYDRQGAVLGAVGPDGQMSKGAISPDGTTVAADRLDLKGSAYDIFLHDLKGGIDSELTFSPGGVNELPAWSPDGSQIAYDSRREGKFGIWVKPAGGSGKEELLLEWPNAIALCDWSRDGKYLVFMSHGTEKGRDLFVISDPLDAARRQTRPFLETAASEGYGRLSPDGRWMAYNSDESRTDQIYVVSFPGKEAKYKISTDGGTRPFWSRDGKELFYLYNRKLMRVEVQAGAIFAHGPPKTLFATRTVAGSLIDISPDGKRFLVPNIIEEDAGLPLNVSINWHAAVKK
jgi:Tol biopolymer transport system component